MRSSRMTGVAFALLFIAFAVILIAAGRGGTDTASKPIAAGAVRFQRGIHILDTMTGGVTFLNDPDAGARGRYVWTADGQYLVFADNTTAIGKAAVYRPDGSIAGRYEGVPWTGTGTQPGQMTSYKVVPLEGSLLQMDTSIFDAATGKLTSVITRRDELPDSIMAPDGSKAVALADARDEVIVTNLRTGEQARISGSNFSDASWSPDSRLIVVTERRISRQQTEMWSTILDADTGERMARIEVPESSYRPWVWSWSPDGKWVGGTSFEVTSPTTGLASVVLASTDGSGKGWQAEGEFSGWWRNGEAVLSLLDGNLWSIGINTQRKELVLETPVLAITGAVASPAGRYILFNAINFGEELYAIDMATGAERYVGPGARGKWSPDGRRIAFQAAFTEFREEPIGITYSMDADGTDVIRHGEFFPDVLSFSCLYLRPAVFEWLADSRSLVVSRHDNVTMGLVISSAETGEQKVVAEDAGSRGGGHFPASSPDGSMLAYTRWVGSDANDGLGNNACVLEILDLKENSSRPLLPYADPRQFSWSPDSRYIVADSWTRYRGATTEKPLVILSIEDGSERPFSEGHYPAWSPDGSRIAFVHGNAVVIERLADGRLVRVEVSGNVETLAWSPDGRLLAYDVDPLGPSPRTYVVLADVPGSGGREFVGGYPDWSPDGKAILVTRIRP